MIDHLNSMSLGLISLNPVTIIPPVYEIEDWCLDTLLKK
jgi:hypothetical protein